MLRTILAAAIAAAIAWLDLRLEDQTLSLLLVFAFAITFGTAAPRRPWRWGLIFGVCVPLAHLLARFTGWMPTDPARLIPSFLALLPAFTGAYGGFFFRLMVRNILAKE